MGRLAATFRRAVSLHHEAAALLTLAGDGRPARPATLDEVRALCAQLSAVATTIAPGWAGGALDPPPVTGTASPESPIPVRLGSARPTIGAPADEPDQPGSAGSAGRAGRGPEFPALVPLLGGTHLAFEPDARDPRVAAALRMLLVRLLGAVPPAGIRVLASDPTALGATFGPLRPLVDAGVMEPPVTDDDGLRDLLAEAERHAQQASAHTAHPAHPAHPASGWLLVVAASAPEGRAEFARLAALTHAGAAAKVCVLIAGYHPRRYAEPPPPLGNATLVRADPDNHVLWLTDPPGQAYSGGGTGLVAPVQLDPDPPLDVVTHLAGLLGEQVRRYTALSFTDLVPSSHWTESSVEGLNTIVGRSGRTAVSLGFDDVTPHWLVGGRTGGGKTVFLLDVLYGLAARYSPDELAMYLLDFKEGVSFTEFVPTGHDGSWIPHARAVGIESDREYGVAVLRELRREMNRRAGTLKRFGATKLADLRRDSMDDVALPRVVAVIDEFHVLLAGNDVLAREATGLLEELARKGRSYGIHLVLASQTISGVEALYGKTDSIFGQFPQRIALPGGGGVLDVLNDAAAALPLGSAIVNASGGIAGANLTVRFPDAHAGAVDVAALRRTLWSARPPGSPPPAVFRGYDEVRLEDDPVYAALKPGVRRPMALVGRNVDVGLSTAAFPLDATPGRHMAVIGTSTGGADVLHAAAISLSRQHSTGTARFVVAPLVAAGDAVADETMDVLRRSGHDVSIVDSAGLRDELGKLADPAAGPTAGQDVSRTYVVVFGMDAASGALTIRDQTSFRTGLDDLQVVLRQGPVYGIHLLAWWRGLRRFSEDIGGSANREDIACLVALNVPGGEIGGFLGQHDLSYAPKPNRALFVDRHDQRQAVIVPFVRPGHAGEED